MRHFLLSRSGTCLALAALAGAGCVSDRPTAAEPPVVGATVDIENFAFVPASLSAQTGTVIRWTNKDDVAHTVTADENAFDSGTLSKDGTFELTAGQPGTYTYSCQIHPFMKATLVVTP